MTEVRRRAQALLSKMTLTEKVGQLAQQLWGFTAYTRDENGEIILTEEFKSYVLRFGGIGKLYGYIRSDPWSNAVMLRAGLLFPKVNGHITSYKNS